MKHFLVFLCLLITSTCYASNWVPISKDTKGGVWSLEKGSGHFAHTKDGVGYQVGATGRFISPTKDTTFFYVATDIRSCAAGEGALALFPLLSQNKTLYTVVHNGGTNASNLFDALCAVAAEMLKQVPKQPATTPMPKQPVTLL